MRKTLQLLTVLTAVLYCTPAQAVVDPYEAMVITPAEGEVTSLQHFTITFGDLPVTVNSNAVPTLEKGGGSTLQGHISLDSDGTTVVIDFDENSTASGDYYLNIPENTLTVNGQRLLPLTLRFNISGDAASFHEQITVDPAEGMVESLQNFTISFPKYIGGINYGHRATLTNTRTGKTYQADMYTVGYKLLVYFPDQIKKAGEYTLTIPANTVEIYTIDFEVEELNFHYTIDGSEEQIFYDQVTIDPAEGTVLSLQDFTISFPEAVQSIADGSKATLTCTTSGAVFQADMTANGSQVTMNFPEEITEPGDYTLTIPEASLDFNTLSDGINEMNFNYAIKSIETAAYTVTPPEGELYLLQNFTISYDTTVEVNEDAVATLVNDETGETFVCHLIEIGGNAMFYKQSPLSVVGNYTLHVPAACIEILANGTVNPEMTFHYTIIEKEYYIPPVIENQPEGELRMYYRTGGMVREVEKEQTVEEGENPYEIVIQEQDGSVNIVFAEDGKVYIQRPVSWSYYDGWVEGTLSADGKTITVPMGQYVAYTKSLEMAVQVGLFVYDESKDTYVYDASIDQLTYTIHDDGSISQDDTDQYIILGTMNRAFGQNFQYLDYEWLQAGDFASVYLPVNEVPQTPPEGMAVEEYYLTTAVNDGMEWEPYTAIVNVGFDGDDMWVQGISKYLPSAWIKGTREGNTVTFANPQLLGSFETLIYFKAADFNPVNGNTTQKDMVLTIDDENTFYTYDYVFITADKNNLSYINYYQGLTISRNPDALIEAPEGARAYDYTFKYNTRDENGNTVARETAVTASFSGDCVYIKGMWEYLPDSWVMGHFVDGKLVFDLPQYIGVYDQEYEISYPIYLNGFDDQTGLLKRQVLLDYDPMTKMFSNQSTPMGFGINKTGYLNVLDINEAMLKPVQSFLTGDVNDDGKVNIGDVTDLINYLLSGNASAINLAAADVNGDGKIKIDDVTNLINILLGS